MEKIFQNINGNAFKLNQTTKEELPIIKETVEDYDQYYRVSKADEDFALNYIRRKLMPANVNDFNSDVDWQNSLRGKKHFRRVTPEEVSRKLEKTLHIRNTGRKTDHIEYKANVYDTEILGWITFKYDIYRNDNDGNLTVKYWHNFSSYAFMVNISKPEKIKESVEDEWWHINKEEEAQALQYIRRRFKTEFGDLVGKKIKKLRHKTSSTSPDQIEYGGWLPGGHWIGFTILKKHDGGLWIARLDKGQTSSDAWYFVNRAGSPGEELQEEKSDDVSISKQEEFQALEFIKRKVIPFAMGLYKTGVDRKEQIPNTIKQLQKIKHEKRGESNRTMSIDSDYIEYKSVLVDKPLVFIIMKRKSKEYPEDDEYTSVLTAGFYGLLDHSPLKFKRPYLWPVDFDNKNRLALKESVELGIISRMEEQEAFNFIKKMVVPKVVSIYNDKNQRGDSLARYNLYEPITVQDVNKHLVKRRHVKSDKHRFGHSDMIEYMASMPSKGKPNAGPTFEFQVFKDADGTFISYAHPFKMENWIMRVGRNY